MADAHVLLESIFNTACIIEDEVGGGSNSTPPKKGTLARNLKAMYLKTGRKASRHWAANKEGYKGGLLGAGLGTAATAAGAYALRDKLADADEHIDSLRNKLASMIAAHDETGNV